MQKQSILLIMPHFFQLLVNNHCLNGYLTNYTSNLLLLTYLYIFMKSIWWKVCHKQLCYSLTHLISYGEPKSISKSFKKLCFCHTVVFFSFFFFFFFFFFNSIFPFSSSNHSCFHKNSCKCISHFFYLCARQHWLISYFLKVNKFDWCVWIWHTAALSEKLLTAFVNCTDQLF